MRTSLPLGIGIGLAAMYLFDPDRGGRRRALLRDKMGHWARKGRHLAESRARYTSAWIGGRVTEARLRAKHEPVDDDILVERVRANLGHVVEHPHGIRVEVDNGIVHLFGMIPVEEREALLKRVSHVRGVVSVEDHLGTIPVSETPVSPVA